MFSSKLLLVSAFVPSLVSPRYVPYTVPLDLPSPLSSSSSSSPSSSSSSPSPATTSLLSSPSPSSLSSSTFLSSSSSSPSTFSSSSSSSSSSPLYPTTQSPFGSSALLTTPQITNLSSGWLYISYGTLACGGILIAALAVIIIIYNCFYRVPSNESSPSKELITHRGHADCIEETGEVYQRLTRPASVYQTLSHLDKAYRNLTRSGSMYESEVQTTEQDASDYENIYECIDESDTHRETNTGTDGQPDHQDV